MKVVLDWVTDWQKFNFWDYFASLDELLNKLSFLSQGVRTFIANKVRGFTPRNDFALRILEIMLTLSFIITLIKN